MQNIPIFYTIRRTEDSDTLIRRCAACYTGEAPASFEIHRERAKKPYFTSHPALHFSVSHSENLWICAFTPAEIGCDIQLRRRDIRWERLTVRWFHPHERENVRSSRDFCDVWSRKEAVVKAVGCGIDEKYKTFDTTSGETELCGIRLRITDLALPISRSEEFSAAAAYPETVSCTWIPIDKI